MRASPPKGARSASRSRASAGRTTGPFGSSVTSGVEITDTAPYRYPYYHTRDDTPDKVDYERTARVVVGLENVVGEIAGR